MIITYILSRQDYPDSMQMLGYIPDDWRRTFGFTTITSFLTHSNFWHLFGNCYFLLIFGDNVENEIGKVKYVFLILGAHFTGLLLHTLLDPIGSTPLVGASAGISGIIAFYCIAYPKQKISWVIRFWFYFYKIKFHAWLYLVLWLLMQFFIAYRQIAGRSNISALAHLGGVLVGIIAVTIFKHNKRNLPKKKTAKDYKNAIIS